MGKSLYGLVIVIFLSSFSGCFEYDDVNFRGVESFNIENKSLSDLSFKVGLNVDNPNPYNIKIKPSTLDIYVNDKYAGKAKITEKVVLRKNTSAVYYTTISTNGKEVLKAMGGSLKAIFGSTAKIGLKGKVKGGAYGITKSFPVDFTESVSLRDMM